MHFLRPIEEKEAQGKLWSVASSSADRKMRVSSWASRLQVGLMQQPRTDVTRSIWEVWHETLKRLMSYILSSMQGFIGVEIISNSPDHIRPAWPLEM